MCRSFCIVLSSIIHAAQTPQWNGIETKQFHITYGHIIHHCQCQKRRVERRAPCCCRKKKNKSRKATKLTPVKPTNPLPYGHRAVQTQCFIPLFDYFTPNVGISFEVFVRMVSKWAWVGWWLVQCNAV